MQAPVDYPLNDAAHTAKFSVDELTYAVMLDRGDHQDMPVAPEAFLFEHIEPAPAEYVNREPQGFRSVPKPLATIAQTLIAGHSGQRKIAPGGMLSRLVR